MNSSLLIHWLRWYDPVHHGLTLAGLVNGVCLTNGFFFPRIRGGYNLYRAVGVMPVRGDEVVGAAGAVASTIRTFPWVSHSLSSAYRYRLVSVGGGGVENWADETITSFELDENGDWNGLVPNAPADLQLAPMSGGRFAVRWTYLPQGQEVEPAGFHLYTSYEGVLEYGSISACVPFDCGRVHYEFVTQPRSDGERVGWAVRAYSPSGCEEQNMNQVYALARSLSPPINPAVIISVI